MKFLFTRRYSITIISILFSIFFSSFGIYTYQVLYAPNVWISEGIARDFRINEGVRVWSGDLGGYSFFVEKGEDFFSVVSRLREKKIIGDALSLATLARVTGKDRHMKAGSLYASFRDE